MQNIRHVRKNIRHVSWQSLVTGDVLFSALGTTIKAAGSQAAQYQVDYTYPMAAAKAARQNGVSTYVLISSPWAAPDSRTFYRRMKGELERDTEGLELPRTRFLRPGPLDGRQEGRTGERAVFAVLRSLSPRLPRVVAAHGFAPRNLARRERAILV